MPFQLYKFQEEDVEKIERQTAGLIGSEMGVGKTHEAIALDEVWWKKGALPTLVVAPLNTLDSWVEKYSIQSPKTDVTVIDRKNREAFVDAIRRKRGDVFLMHWDALRLLPELRTFKFNTIVADEVHRASNRKAQATLALKRLKTNYKLGMSGTATGDKPQNLWSVLNWLWPQYYRCNPAEAPIWMADGSFKSIEDVREGDEVVGWTNGSNGRRRLCTSKVLKAFMIEDQKLVRAKMSSGRIIRCTPDHWWLNWHHPTSTTKWVNLNPEGRRGHGNPTLVSVTSILPELTKEQEEAALWLGGIIDGEGSITLNPSIHVTLFQSSLKNPEVHARITEVLKLLEIPFTLEPDSTDRFRLTGGRTTWLKLLNWCKIIKKRQLLVDILTSSRLGQGGGQSLNPGSKDRVVAIEYEPGTHTVYALQTTTGNYVAWGLASKNSYWRFFNHYTEWGWHDPSEKDYRIVTGIKNTKSLKEEMSPWYIRHLKREQCCDHHPRGVMSWLEDKVYDMIWVDLNPTQKRVYKQMSEQMVAWIGEHEDEPLAAGVVVAQMARLSQIALATPELYTKVINKRLKDEAGEWIRNETTGLIETVRVEEEAVRLKEPSTKLDALGEFLKDHDNKQFVIASSSKQICYIAQEKFARQGISSFILSGDTPQSERDGMAGRFARGDTQLFIGVIEAMAEGIDGLQHATDTMVFLDRSWKTIKNKQCEDRLHRGGQKNTVQIIDLMARGTLDFGRRTKLEVKWGWLKEILGDPVKAQKGLLQ